MLDEQTREELTEFFAHTLFQWAKTPNGQYIMAFPDEDMAQFAQEVLWHYYGLTFTIHNDAPVACLLLPVHH